MSSLRTLILGGTTEASALAERLAGDPRFDATVSLAGVTRAPKRLALPVRIGGFGGADGLAGFLRAEAIEALVDATHPFAAIMSANAHAAARQAGVPHLAIDRPAWTAVEGDRWIEVPDMAGAAAALGGASRRVFLTIGRKDLAPFAAAPQHHYVIRSVDPPPADLLPPDATVISARGPFDEANEGALMDERRIEFVVTKNSGGSAAAAKLAAARKRGIAVVMIARPPAPEGDRVRTAEEAFDWLVARHHASGPERRGV